MTPFGAKLREMRASRQITLKEMAAGLEVSSAYLSALEHGHRGKPNWYFVQRVISYFNVIWDEAEEIQRLAERSDPKISIDTGGLEPQATELSNLLAEKIRVLSAESCEKLIHELMTASVKDENT